MDKHRPKNWRRDIRIYLFPFLIILALYAMTCLFTGGFVCFTGFVTDEKITDQQGLNDFLSFTVSDTQKKRVVLPILYDVWETTPGRDIRISKKFVYGRDPAFGDQYASLMIERLSVRYTDGRIDEIIKPGSELFGKIYPLNIPRFETIAEIKDAITRPMDYKLTIEGVLINKKQSKIKFSHSADCQLMKINRTELGYVVLLDL